MGSETPTGALTFEFGLLCLNTNVGKATDVRLSSMRGCSKGRAKGFRRHIKTFAKQNSTSSMTMCMKSAVPAGARQTTKHHWNDVEKNVRENTKYMDSNQMFPHTPAPRHDGTNKHKTDQRTNYLSREVYTLNIAEESEVLQSRLPAISSNGPSQSSKLFACHRHGDGAIPYMTRASSCLAMICRLQCKPCQRGN